MKNIVIAMAFTLLTSTSALAYGVPGGSFVFAPTIPHIDGEKVAAFYTCLFTRVCVVEDEE
jgi:hypothetical protein